MTIDTAPVLAVLHEQFDNNNAICAALIDWAIDGADYGAETDADVIRNVVRRLEETNCAGCSAPPGLIYTADIAEKFALWFDCIDTAMDEYHDEIGEWFAPKTSGELVWFAVEWFANRLAVWIDADIVTVKA
jgi:hypothetical protein